MSHYYGSSVWADSVLKRVVRIARGLESKVYPSNLSEMHYYLGTLREQGYEWHYYVGSCWLHRFLASRSRAEPAGSDSPEREELQP